MCCAAAFFDFGSRGEAAAMQVSAPMLEGIMPRASAPQQPRARSLLAPPLRPTCRADWYPVASVLAQRCCLYGAPSPPLPHLGGWALLRLRCRRVRTLHAGVAGGAAAALVTLGSTGPYEPTRAAVESCGGGRESSFAHPPCPQVPPATTCYGGWRVGGQARGGRAACGSGRRRWRCTCRAARFFSPFFAIFGHFNQKSAKFSSGLRRFAQ